MPNTKQKIYVVDTNVIINDPNFVKKIKGKILLPITVLQELDHHKFGSSEKARKTREFARFIDKNSEMIWFHDSTGYEGTNDEKIIKTAAIMKNKGHDVILVTNDILMGLIAKSTGIEVKKHQLNNYSQMQIYSGIKNLKNIENNTKNIHLNPNEYVISHDGLGRKTVSKRIKKLKKDINIWGLTHRNVEQRCALDALLDNKIQLVTISGKAGTGKTLLALLAGLKQVIINHDYSKLLVARPVVSMGQDVGFLPGELDEKLAPWMQPIYDNIEVILNKQSSSAKKTLEKLSNDGIIEIGALNYIRGRSIPNQFIIIDESQNLTKHEIKTIISRAGQNTKVVLTGDVTQIDNNKVDMFSNGFTYVINKFINENIAAHVNLEKCERSELAKIAAEIL